MAEKRETQERLQSLRKLLSEGESRTQIDLQNSLQALGFEMNLSTISRDLRKLGAIKTLDTEGITTYKLSDEILTGRTPTGLGEMITDVTENGSLVVITTAPACASVVARIIDQFKNEGEILGTIAGDDTVFVAPSKIQRTKQLRQAILKLIR